MIWKKIIIITFLLCSLSSCSKKKKIFFGNQIFNIVVNDKNIETTFTFKNLSSSSFLKMLINDCLNNHKSLKKEIKSSQDIYLNIGLADVLNDVKKINDTYIYEYHPSTMDLLLINVNNIINEIYYLNEKIKIHFISIYCPYVNNNSSFYKDVFLAIDIYNLSLKKEFEELDFIYINKFTSLLKSFDQINEENHERVIDYIYG